MALSANIGSTFAAKFGTIQTYTAGASIYRGATVVIRQTDGLAYPAVEDIADTFKQLVVGYAQEAAETAASIRVRMDGKLRRVFSGGGEPADYIGRLACVKDDESVQIYDAGTGKTVAGRITEKISATAVYVDFTDRPIRLATSAND